jgi:hypothetical protein
MMRLSGVCFVIAGAGVMVDAIWHKVLGIGFMWFGILLGTAGLVLLLRRQAGGWVAGLGLAGAILLLVAESLYALPGLAFAWSNAIAVLVIGLALIPAGRLARLASVLWLIDGVMKLPIIRGNTFGFQAFGLALLVLGCVLWMEAGSGEGAIGHIGPGMGALLVDQGE